MVERTVYVGASRQVIVRLATGAPLQVSVANTGSAEGYRQGTPVAVHVPQEALRVLGGDTGALAPDPDSVAESAATTSS
jgi:hypothetical protein